MRWLLTYADLITLLLVFFIILYAMASQTEESKRLELNEALAAAFSPLSSNRAFPVLGSDFGKGIRSHGRYDESKDAQTLLEEIKDAAKALNQPIEVRFHDEELMIHLPTPEFFLEDRVTLREEAKPFLERLSNLISIFPNQIDIISYQREPRGPEAFRLSSQQAATVVKYLTQIRPADATRLVAVGVGNNASFLGEESEDVAERLTITVRMSEKK